MEEVFLELSKYGFPGVVIGVGVFFFHRMQQIYHQERDEWRQDLLSQSEKFMEVTSKQHDQLVEVTKDTHSILSEIKTIISIKQ